MVAGIDWGTDLTATAARLGLIGALAAGLLLAGCGRKGPLEPPPSASVVSAEPGTGPSLGEPEHRALESERRAGRAPAAAPASGQRKSFPLDFLLDGPSDGPQPVR